MKTPTPGWHFSRLLWWLAGFLTVVLAFLFVFQHLRSESLRDNWEEVSANESAGQRSEITGAFNRFHAETVAATENAAAALLARAREGTGNDSASGLFRFLQTIPPADLSLELYDTSGFVLAWKGSGGSPVGREHLTPEQSSFILDGPIYSYLTVVVPISSDEGVAVYLVGKRLFNVSHPVDNRFVSNRALAVSFASTFDPEENRGVKFFVRNPAEGNDTAGRGDPGHSDSQTGTESGGNSELFVQRVSFAGISGTEIAYALLPVPDLNSSLEETDQPFSRWESLVALLLLCVLLWGLERYIRGLGKVLWRIILGLVGIWIIRYAMILTNIPNRFFDTDLFTPSLFASAFGFGAAGSLWDMFLTAIVLSVTMWVLFIHISGPSGGENSGKAGGGKSRSEPSPLARILLGTGVIISLAFLGPLARGLYAIIRSAVFDSRIDINDPKIVFPGPEMGMLLFGFYLVVLSMILGGMIFVLLSESSLRWFTPRLSTGARWWIISALTIIGSLAFDFFHRNPLGSPGEKVVIFGGILLLSYLSDRNAEGRGVLPFRSSVLVISLFTVVVFMVILDEKVHEHDKTMVETVVRDYARPEDAWMNFLMNEALDEMSGPDAAEVLRSGEYTRNDKLAFSSWAGSVLGREGNNCSVTYIDLEGSVVSYFHVGVAPHWSREHHMDEMPRSTRMITKEIRTLRGKLTTWYKGYAPVLTADSQFVGGVWVGISPIGPEKILGQEYDLLTTSRKYEHRSGGRDIMLSEFTDGKMSYCSNEDIPFGRNLASLIPVAGIPGDGIWVTERASGRTYESFYLQRSDKTALGIGIPAPDLAWHFYSYSRYLLFFLTILILAAAAFAAVRMLRARVRTVSFRTKLMALFAVVSVIPVLLLAYYNRESLLREADESSQSFLRSETELVLNEVQTMLGMTVPYELSFVDDESLEEIASRIKTEFYLYGMEQVQASSRPELFAAELIDRRMSAPAYLNLFLLGSNFFSERQTIGTIAYLVGYRPLRAQSGEVIGAVAVPTLFRQEEVEESAAREAVVLSGIYILVLGVSLLIGTLMANRIARPMRRLIGAARRVATGDLDVRIESDRSDEIGELESAFNSMTSDLRGVQEKVKKAERELAWKEMARQVAHEIKNPLTPMRLSVQHLVSAYRDKSAEFGTLIRTVSATILEQIDSLSRIASEFSAFARFPEGKPVTVDLHAVIREAVELYRQDRADFRMSLGPDPVPVTADREDLRRAFINIFRNSIQAASEGVGIDVATVVSSGEVEITIKDNGPGVEEDIRKRLFEPNFSTKTGGMGIGLTLVKKTVEDAGGSISLGSIPGAGTTILIRLPLAAAPDR